MLNSQNLGPVDIQDQAKGDSSAKNTNAETQKAVDATTKRGSNNATTRDSSKRGRQIHSDKPGNLPDQLREKYPDTTFEFTKSGQAGQDVKVTGGVHPSEYPGSTWQRGVNYGDFKPATPGGDRTFKSDQKNKWKQPTQKLPYNPETGLLQ